MAAPCPAARASAITASISGTASASAPPNPASTTAPSGAWRGPPPPPLPPPPPASRAATAATPPPGLTNAPPVHPPHHPSRHPRLAAALHLAVLTRIPALPAPHHDRDDRSHPAPSPALRQGHLFSDKDPRCPPQQRCRLGTPLGDQDGQPVQQQVGRAGHADR